MPVILNHYSNNAFFRAPDFDQNEVEATDTPALEIGLVNNMPDSALESTELQFLRLLNKASSDVIVSLKLYFLPDIPRSEMGRRHINQTYRSVAELWNQRLDGLIVTGTEPCAPSLRDEPYWSALTALFDWADGHATSTIASCLAAHAAVLHLDGVGRHLLAEKRSGVFDCVKLSERPPFASVAPRLNIVHSRLNELREAELAQCGYQIITRSTAAGVDTFAKQKNSLFVFFQGHPEYDEQALLREYRRDVARYLRCERETYPQVPQNYFNKIATAALTTFGLQALSERRESLIDDFPISTAKSGLIHTGDSAPVTIYRSWIGYLLERRAQRKLTIRLTRPEGNRAAVSQSAERVI